MRSNKFLKTILFNIALIAPTFADLPPADDTIAKTPPPLEVTVDEKLGADLSQLKMADETGKIVKLKDLHDGKRPIIIAPVYYNCPHLCTLTLNGLLQAIEREKDYKLGKDYQIITYSFNPDEGPNLAKTKQSNYLRKLSAVNETNITNFIPFWHFLTGSAENIGAISSSIGFKYLKETSTNPKKTDTEYVHPALIIITTPDLKISRYLYGVEYSTTDFHMALLEAGEGKISKTISDRLLLTCYSFDPVKRKYSLVAWRVMRLGSITAGVLLVGFVALLWLRERRKKA